MTLAEAIIPSLLGLVGGYVASMYTQRVSVINAFTGLVEKELSDLTGRSDNVGGEHGIDSWHSDSKRRVEAFSALLGDKPYLREEEFRDALADYCRNNIDYITVGRTGLIEKLCRVYRAAKHLG